MPVFFMCVCVLFADDEIRQNEGFKNVSFGNVILAASQDKRVPLLRPEDEVSLSLSHTHTLTHSLSHTLTHHCLCSVCVAFI